MALLLSGTVRAVSLPDQEPGLARETSDALARFEITPQQAADLMGVSRTFFIDLPAQGRIPFRIAGEQQRVRCCDLLNYLEAYKKEAGTALDEMAVTAQRLGLYE